MIAFQKPDLATPAIIRPMAAFPNQCLYFFPFEPSQIADKKGGFCSSPREMVIGPYTEGINLRLSPMQTGWVLKVDFQPGALYRLMGLPMHEIRNQPFDGGEGFGRDIRQVTEQLREAVTFNQMIQLVEGFLLKKAAKARKILPIDQVFSKVLSCPQQQTIDQLAACSCLSLRQFERQFLDRLGISPKFFIRQARFTQAYLLKRKQPQLSWTEVAYQCGYFDQMHLIRDFKQFSSYTPTAYFRQIPAPAIIL
jgi:AraC-like DNA-binding protein